MSRIEEETNTAEAGATLLELVTAFEETKVSIANVFSILGYERDQMLVQDVTREPRALCDVIEPHIDSLVEAYVES